MFFRRKHLVELGYQVLGLDFGSNNSYNNYVKYFDEHNAMVVFSTIHNNRVLLYRLTKEQYRDFKNGKFALSQDGRGHGTTPTGHEIKNYGLRTIFHGGDISRIAHLKEMLDVAEELAIGNDVKFEINSKLSRIKK